MAWSDAARKASAAARAAKAYFERGKAGSYLGPGGYGPEVTKALRLSGARDEIQQVRNKLWAQKKRELNIKAGRKATAAMPKPDWAKPAYLRKKPKRGKRPPGFSNHSKGRY